MRGGKRDMPCPERFRERYKRESVKRWFWKGAWYIVFSFVVGIALLVITFFVYGASSLIFARSRLMFGVTIGVFVVLWVLGVIGSGWAQEQADKRVTG